MPAFKHHLLAPVSPLVRWVQLAVRNTTCVPTICPWHCMAGQKMFGDTRQPMHFQALIPDVLYIYNKLVLVGYVEYSWCKTCWMWGRTGVTCLCFWDFTFLYFLYFCAFFTYCHSSCIWQYQLFHFLAFLFGKVKKLKSF